MELVQRPSCRLRSQQLEQNEVILRAGDSSWVDDCAKCLHVTDAGTLLLQPRNRCHVSLTGLTAAGVQQVE